MHVGAHEGQEMPFYREAGIGQITLVEPIPALDTTAVHVLGLEEKRNHHEVLRHAVGVLLAQGPQLLTNAAIELGSGDLG